VHVRPRINLGKTFETSRKVAVICHGYQSNADQGWVRSMEKALIDQVLIKLKLYAVHIKLSTLSTASMLSQWTGGEALKNGITSKRRQTRESWAQNWQGKVVPILICNLFTNIS